MPDTRRFPQARRFSAELERLSALDPDTAQTLFARYEDVLLGWGVSAVLVDMTQDALEEALRVAEEDAS